MGRYSQYDEDVLISTILSSIQTKVRLNRWCVELGAWDGIKYSNVCKLIKEQSYSAVLIEANRRRFKELCRNFPESSVIKLNCFVSPSGKDSLDEILWGQGVPVDFDVLSVDVDGMDFHLFSSLRRFRPRVVVVEFNPTIPNGVEYINPRCQKVMHGSSVSSLIELASSKGYVATGLTHCNIIFVCEEIHCLTGLSVINLSVNRPEGNDRTIVFTGFDGTVIMTRSHVEFPWHGLSVPSQDVQFLPRFFRRYGGDFGFIRKVLFLVYLTMFRQSLLRSLMYHRINLIGRFNFIGKNPKDR